MVGRFVRGYGRCIVDDGGGGLVVGGLLFGGCWGLVVGLVLFWVVLC